MVVRLHHPQPLPCSCSPSPAGFSPVASPLTSTHCASVSSYFWGALTQTLSKASFFSFRMGFRASGVLHLPQVCSPPPSFTPGLQLHSGHVLEWAMAACVQNLLLTFPSTPLLPEGISTQQTASPSTPAPKPQVGHPLSLLLLSPVPGLLPPFPCLIPSIPPGLRPHTNFFQTGFPSTPVTVYKVS